MTQGARFDQNRARSANGSDVCLIGPGRDKLPAASVLFVGQRSDLVRAARHLPPATILRNCAIQALPSFVTGATLPDMVVSLAIAEGFDCVDLAQLLQLYGYRGRYRVLAPGLPHPALVRREIAQLCADIDFDILSPGRLAD